MTIKMTYIKKGSGNNENFYAAIFSMNRLQEGKQKRGTSSREQRYDFVINTGIAYLKNGYGRKFLLEGRVSETKYIQTATDHITSDHLLKLPECDSVRCSNEQFESRKSNT